MKILLLMNVKRNKQLKTEHEVYKDELKKYFEMKSNIETKCEKDLRGKLQVEVNDLEKILKLKDDLHENGLDEPIVEQNYIIIDEEKSMNGKYNIIQGRQNC